MMVSIIRPETSICSKDEDDVGQSYNLYLIRPKLIAVRACRQSISVESRAGDLGSAGVVQSCEP